MFITRLTKLLNIHSDDTPRLVSLSVLNMLLVFLASFGSSVVTSLFLKRYGVEYLPRMYLITSFAAAVCTLFVLRLGSIKRDTLLTGSCVIFGTLVIAARLLLQAGIAAACPVLYVLAELAALFFYTQFWALAVETCDVREGKRIFTYVVCAGLIGGMLAGAGVNLLAGGFGSDNLLILWAILFFAAALYIRKTAPEPAPSPAGDEAEKSFTAQLKDTAYYFGKSGHVRVLMACVILAVISASVMDFVFNKIMDRAFANENELTAFYGAYSIAFYAGTLFVQLILTNRVVRLLGTGNTLLLLPAWSALGFGSLLVSFGYHAAAAARYFKDLVSASFSDSVVPLLFSPLKEDVRDSIIAIAEGLVTPLGTAFAGVVLMALAKAPDRAAAAAGLGFVLLWIYFGFRLKSSYQSAFIANLAEKSLPDLSAIEDIGKMGEGQAVRLLSRAIRSEDDTVSRFAMRTLARTKTAASTGLLAQYLEENPASRRKADLLGFLGELKGDESRLAVIERFLADPDPLVRAKAAGAFLSADEARVKERILPLLRDPDARVRVNAVMALWRSGARQEYVDILSSAVCDPSEETRCWAGFALREIRAAETLPLLLALSRDPRPKVRLEAVKGLSRFEGEEAAARLLEMLNDENRKIRQAAFRTLAAKEGVTCMLEKNCETCAPKEREQIVRILAARQEGEDIVFRHLEDELRSIYKRVVWMTVLKREKQKPGIELFTATLANRNRRALDRVLKISSSIEGSTAFGLIVKRLKDKDPRSLAEALELLDTMTLHKRSFLKSVISLLEGLPENDLAEYARKDLGIGEYSAEEIYRECLSDPAEEWFKACAAHLTNQEAV